MGANYDKIATPRDFRAAAAAAVDDINRGATITQNGVDLTEPQRRFHQNVLAKIDALVAVYEDINALWTSRGE